MSLAYQHITFEEKLKEEQIHEDAVKISQRICDYLRKAK